MKTQNPRELSPVEVCFRLVGGKYKGAILWYLAKKGPLRFSKLVKYLPQVNPKMLTQQLRAMELDGVVSRTVYPEVPLRVEYSITPFGASLIPVIQVAHQWGLNYVRGLPEDQAPRTPKSRPCYEEDWQP